MEKLRTVIHFPQCHTARKAELGFELAWIQNPCLPTGLTQEIMSYLQDLKAYLSSLFLFSPQYSHCHRPGTLSLSPFLTLLFSSLCFSISPPVLFSSLLSGPEPNSGFPGGQDSSARISLSLLPGVSRGGLFPLLNLESICWCLFKDKYYTPRKGTLRHQH